MSDCSLGMRPRRECPVCVDAARLTFTVNRYGSCETWLRPQTVTGTARYCPECGRRLRNGAIGDR